MSMIQIQVLKATMENWIYAHLISVSFVMMKSNNKL